MRIYGISGKAIQGHKRNGLIRSLATTIFAMALGAGIPIVGGFAPIWILLLVIPCVAIISSISIRRALKRLEANKASYQLLVGPASIVKKQLSMRDIEIYADQIANITEIKGMGICIRTSDKKSFIEIPDGLERYDEVKEHISAWKPLNSSTKRPYTRLLPMVAVLSFAIAFAGMWLSSNLLVTIVSGTFVVVYTIVALVYLRRREEIDPRLRLSIWRIVFIVFALSLMLYARVYSLLSE